MTGSALLCVGVCAGVLLGAVLDAPRVMVRRWTEEVRTLDLTATPAQPGMKLEEFEALQTAAVPPAAPLAVTRPEPPPGAAEETAAAAVAVEELSPATPALPEERLLEKRPVPARDVAARPVQDAKSLIAAMKQRQERDVRPAARQASGTVVQVAAYKDARSADVLVTRLRKSGFDSYVSRSAPGGPEKFRVRVRPKRSAEIDKLVSTLELRGYRIWVTRE